MAEGDSLFSGNNTSVDSRIKFLDNQGYYLNNVPLIHAVVDGDAAHLVDKFILNELFLILIFISWFLCKKR